MNYPTIFAITESEQDLDALPDQITLTSTGAAAIFAGMVRGVTSRDHPHETVFLEYEAYLSMAEAKMKQVADEIRARWSTIEGIAIVQRIVFHSWQTSQTKRTISEISHPSGISNPSVQSFFG